MLVHDAKDLGGVIGVVGEATRRALEAGGGHVIVREDGVAHGVPSRAVACHRRAAGHDRPPQIGEHADEGGVADDRPVGRDAALAAGEQPHDHERAQADPDG